MNQEYYRGLRRDSICDVLNAPKRVHKLLGTLNVNGVEERIDQHRMTLAMSRDPRRNTQTSAQLAMQIAEKNPDVSVVYFNTYAGRELMRESFRNDHNNYASPPQQRGRMGGGDSGDDELHSTPEHPPLTPPAAAGGEQEKEDCAAFENLHIINIPFGEWNLADIIRTLRPDSSVPNPLNKPLVIILNDFELAGFTAWNRRCVARDLIQLKEQCGATVIVFSHEMREDLKAGLPGRGALGLLAIKSDALHRLPSEFDHLVKTRKQSESATIHEAQTKVTESQSEYKLTRNSLEGGEDLFEIPILSGSFGEPLPTPPLFQGKGLIEVV